MADGILRWDYAKKNLTNYRTMVIFRLVDAVNYDGDGDVYKHFGDCRGKFFPIGIEIGHIL